MKKLTFYGSAVLVGCYLASIVAGQDLAIDVVRAQAITTTRTVTTTKVLSPNGQVISTGQSETPESPPEQTTATLIVAKSDAANVRIHVSNENRLPVPAAPVSKGQWLLPRTGGKLWVRITAIDFEKNIFDERTIVVETEQPDDDVPPDPDVPEPNTPAPIDGEGFKVAIITETSTLPSLPASQQSVMYSAQIRAYLNENCIVANRSPSWRVLDPDQIFGDSNSVWKKVLARDRDSIPWIVISNGKTGFEGPLPMTIDETMALFARFNK